MADTTTFTVLEGKDKRIVNKRVGKADADALAERIERNGFEAVVVTDKQAGTDLASVAPTEAQGRPSDLEALTHEELDSIAKARKIENFPSSGSKAEKAAAIRGF